CRGRTAHGVVGPDDVHRPRRPPRRAVHRGGPRGGHLLHGGRPQLPGRPHQRTLRRQGERTVSDATATADEAGTHAVTQTDIEPGAVLLEVRDLRTTFASERGPVQAVRGVSFDLRRGRTLGIVGESGSGKSVLSRSLMGLVASNATRTGSVRYAG